MKQFFIPLLAFIVVPIAARAGCNCQSGHPTMHAPGIMAGAVMQPPAAWGPQHRAAPLPAPAPPPGTLGETYSRVSHPIPEDEHPRSAMLAVRDKQTVKHLRAQRMSGFRMQNGIWLFESNRPLFPGQDQVVRVEARSDKADIQPNKVKFVRLIPGRIVYLDF